MSRKRILVVDDEVYMLHILEFSLHMEGMEVISAASGQEALQKIAEEPPDLIILDVLMPEMDGYEVCRRLKQEESTRSIPIVFLTAKDSRKDRTFGLDLGADAYITKPFSPQTLVDTITELLEDVHHDGSEAVGM
ncbi:MAG: response regulator [Candidatus Eisenbacteria sp.]|nr:response regulator [Candidatus Eisenbacteria bacterium]